MIRSPFFLVGPDSKNKHSSVEETYFLTPKGNLNYISEKGNGSDIIEEDLECNIQQANKDDVVDKGTTRYAFGHEILLKILSLPNWA